MAAAAGVLSGTAEVLGRTRGGDGHPSSVDGIRSTDARMGAAGGAGAAPAADKERQTQARCGTRRAGAGRKGHRRRWRARPGRSLLGPNPFRDRAGPQRTGPLAWGQGQGNRIITTAET